MGSVCGVRECPECKKNSFNFDYYYKTDEEIAFCEECGYSFEFWRYPQCKKCRFVWFSKEDFEREGVKPPALFEETKCPFCGNKVKWDYVCTVGISKRIVHPDGTVHWKAVKTKSTIWTDKGKVEIKLRHQPEMLAIPLKNLRPMDEFLEKVREKIKADNKVNANK